MDQVRGRKLKKKLDQVADDLAGLRRMVEDDRCCIEALNEIAAVRTALDGVGIELLIAHLESRALDRPGGAQGQAGPIADEELLVEMEAMLSRILKREPPCSPGS